MKFDKNRTKAVLWDLDDTLYSRVQAAHETFIHMFADLWYVGRSEAYIRRAADTMMTFTNQDSMIHLEAFRKTMELFPPDRPFDHAACTEYYYDHIWEYAEPLPKQAEVIRKLRALGVKNAILTNCQENRCEAQMKKIAHLGIGPLFEAIILSGAYGIHKPDPRIYRIAAEKLGVRPEACVFVGDGVTTDIPGALNAQMPAVWFNAWKIPNPFPNEPTVTEVRDVTEFFTL